MEKDFQRWTAKRKVELLLQLIKGEAKLVDVCREHDLTQSEVEGGMEIFLKAGERGLRARTEDEQATYDREVRELRAKVGEARRAATRGVDDDRASRAAPRHGELGSAVPNRWLRLGRRGAATGGRSRGLSGMHTRVPTRHGLVDEP